MGHQGDCEEFCVKSEIEYLLFNCYASRLTSSASRLIPRTMVWERIN